MSGRKEGQSEAFLRRWSRLKSERRAEAAPEPEKAAPPPVAGREAEAAPRSDDPRAGPPDAAASAPLELPPLESLTKDSDFSVFLRDGVPAEVRKMALRKLWRTDPAFGRLDGLVEYGHDYRAIGANRAWKTAYRVGRGWLDRAAERSTDESASPAGDAGAEPAPTASGRAGEEADAEATRAEADDAPDKPAS